MKYVGWMICVVRLIIFYQLAYWCFHRLEAVNLLRPHVDPEAWLHPVELARSLGYEAETHLVQTADDVVLEVHRIGKRLTRCDLRQLRRVPVILQHGLMSASSGWVVNSPQQSLGFLLADAGFDVWLANSRGNVYSKRSASSKPNFWAFTKDHLALVDAPATIDYVLTTSEAKYVHFVGHSQGAFILLALLSERPEYADKIRLGVALAPVLKLTHANSLVSGFFRSMEVFRWLPDFEFMSNQKFPVNLVMNPVVCRLAPTICASSMRLAAGGHRSQVNSTRMAVYASDIPAGTSFANFRHYTQTMLHGRFAKFDYGPSENVRRYSQRLPPDYELSRIRGRLALFYCAADSDILAGAGHNEWLLKSLPRTSIVYSKVVRDIEHMDFQLGINARRLVYDTLIKLLHANSR